MKTILLNLLILTSCAVQTPVLAGDKIPGWLEQRPVHPLYYIGIGSASKENTDLDCQQVAKDNALQDLSSEISIDISSDFVHSITEKAGMVEEDLQSQVRSSTKAFLEGYNLVDTWEDESGYWVYYRLSKDVYAQKRAERKARVTSLSLDSYSKAVQKEKQFEASQALRLYIQSLINLEDFLAEPVKAEYEGKNIYLQNEILSALRDLLAVLELKANPAKLNAKGGQALKNPLMVEVSYRDESGSPHKIAGLPIHFSFVRGSGSLVQNIVSGLDGQAKCPVSKINAGEKLQIINAKLDLHEMYAGQPTELAQNILRNLMSLETKFILNVTGLTAYIEATEQNLGKDVELLMVEPHLKSALSEHGFSFTDDVSKADIMVELKASSRKGAQVYNLYSAFVDLNVSIIDLNSGEELYKKAFNEIKGIQLDYEKAGLKALQTAGQKMEELVPDIIKPLIE